MNCSICGKPFSLEICFNRWTLEHGNNAAPVNTGYCCDVCNDGVVLPARWQLMHPDPAAAPGERKRSDAAQ